MRAEPSTSRRSEQPHQPVTPSPTQEQSLFEFLKDRPSETEVFLQGPVSGLRAQPRRRFARDKFGLGLSGVAGFVDATGFVALFGVFPAHLTGELISIIAFTAGDAPILVGQRVGLVAVFVCAVVVAVVVARRARRATHLSRPQLAPLLTLLALSLWVFAALGAVLQGTGLVSGDWRAFGIAASAVAAMGVQNALMRLGLATCLPTTVMTGNLTQAIVEAVEFLSLRYIERADTRQLRQVEARLLRLGASLGAFLIGATLAVLMLRFVGFFSVAAPALLVSTFAAIAWSESLRG